MLIAYSFRVITSSLSLSPSSSSTSSSSSSSSSPSSSSSSSSSLQCLLSRSSSIVAYIFKQAPLLFPFFTPFSPYMIFLFSFHCLLVKRVPIFASYFFFLTVGKISCHNINSLPPIVLLLRFKIECLLFLHFLCSLYAFFFIFKNESQFPLNSYA